MVIIKRSGGPRTAAGKAITSRNAIQTGAYSTTVILPDESEEEFKELEAQLARSYPSRDAAVIAMVHDLAVIIWKQSRLQRLEHAAVTRVLNKPITVFELASEGVTLPEDCEWLIADRSLLTPDLVSEQIQIRNSILKLQSDFLTDEVIKQIPSKHAKLYSALCSLATGVLDLRVEDLKMPALANRRICQGEPKEERFLNFALRTLLNHAKVIALVQRESDAIDQAIPRIKERRILSLHGMGRPRPRP